MPKSKFKHGHSPFEAAGKKVTDQKSEFVRPGLKSKRQPNSKSGRAKK